jgi:hypothetical protein
MNPRALTDHKNEYVGRNLSLTPELTLVFTQLNEQKPFKQLDVLACADTRLKPDVTEK